MLKINNQNGKYIAKIDSNIYTLDIIKKAIYKFTDKCSFNIDCSQDCTELDINFIEDLQDSDKKKLFEDLSNELLDQDLREKIASQTDSLKNLILANAFSNSKLIEPN